MPFIFFFSSLQKLLHLDTCLLMLHLPFAAFDMTQAPSWGSSWKVGRTDKRDGFDKGLAGGGKQISQFQLPEKPGLLPQLPRAPQHYRKDHITVTACFCPAAWQPCTQSITLLNTLLLSQPSSDTPHACLSNPLTHKLTPAAMASLSDVLRTGKVCVYRCLSIMLLMEGQINHRLKLIGMWNYLKNAN